MRVALTGGATGIGACVLQRMKSQGYHVTAFDISEPEGADRWIHADLAEAASIQQALDEAEGPFDVLINNAGLPPRAGLAEVVLLVNYHGLVAFMNGMLGKLAEGACIVNVASRAGAAWRDNLEQVKALMASAPEDVGTFVLQHDIDATRAYNLSKEAVIVLSMAATQTMVSRGLRMNSVSPAAVSTGILKDFEAAFGEKVARNVARAGRPGLPEEIADVIVFLASPESAWIKGQDIVIDGGMSAMSMADMLGLANVTGN